MRDSRPLADSSLEAGWLQRSRLINSCLLGMAALMGVVAGTGVAVQPGERGLNLSVPQAVLLVAGAAWVFVAYVMSRRHRLRLAGGMTIALAIAVLALAIYALPGYVAALAPFAMLPIGLAALLLGRRAIYLVAALTLLAMVVAVLAAPLLPSAMLAPALAPPGPVATLIMLALAVFLLALILAPLRAELERLVGQLHHGEQALAQAHQQQHTAERAREAALAELAERQRHFERLLDQISDGAIAVDRAGMVVRASAGARALWADLAGDDLLGQAFDRVCAELAGQSPASEHVRIVTIADEAPGQDWGYTHLLLDRREHARLARLRSELLVLLANEMRNPLTSMVTALEMTLGQNLPEGADRVLVGARRSGQRLLDLVTTLIEINQIEQNPGGLRRAATPLRPILEAGIAQTAPLAQQGAVTVVVEYRGDGVIQLDTERMQRAVVYLLESALRHSPPYSTVQVRTERQNGSLVVRISDQGPGLTTQQREGLLGQRPTTDERSAPALGLAFSKLVIEAHGGKVWIESTGSQGSTYAFSLPVEP
jgi:signal transduction histidine kinase